MEQPVRLEDFVPPDRLLQTPGPSPVPNRVYRAMTLPMLGHLDSEYLDVMRDVQKGLRYVMQTQNEYTFAVNGSGSAAMETAFSNLVEPDDSVLIVSVGFFGDRMAQMAKRAGGDVTTLKGQLGTSIDISNVENSIQSVEPTVIGIVHGETSTGVVQPDLKKLSSIARSHDALTIVDGVASIGGVEFLTDEWGIDVAYAGSQKCISAPPGASPITFSDRAIQKVKNRNTPASSWYFDIEGIWEYWNDNPVYHHTGPLPLMFALREAIRIISEEGLENRWHRHDRLTEALRSGLTQMDVELFVEDNWWLPSATSVLVPPSVDSDKVLQRLKTEYSVNIGSGLGELSDELFRIGCMGHSCTEQNLLYFLMAFGNVLRNEGAEVDIHAGLAAFVDAL